MPENIAIKTEVLLLWHLSYGTKYPVIWASIPVIKEYPYIGQHGPGRDVSALSSGLIDMTSWDPFQSFFFYNANKLSVRDKNADYVKWVFLGWTLLYTLFIKFAYIIHTTKWSVIFGLLFLTPIQSENLSFLQNEFWKKKLLGRPRIEPPPSNNWKALCRCLHLFVIYF